MGAVSCKSTKMKFKGGVCSNLRSVAVITMTKSNVWEKRVEIQVILPAHSLSLREIGAGTEAETLEESAYWFPPRLVLSQPFYFKL